MNTTAIIAALIALLGGFAAGNTLSNTETTSDATGRNNQNQERFMSENPPAQDFVSMRPGISDLPSETLSQSETDGLLLMREEEKLARDVYQTLYEKWGLQIFANIAQSEQTHTEAVRDLLEKYNLTDPVTDDTVGVFTNETMQKLYDDLVIKGNQSETAALTVGATIEDLDINDLQKLLAETDNQDITLVYENLLRGSRNHLRAFTKQLTMRNETYAPQYISSTDYESIQSSQPETGAGQHSGEGQGKGGRGWGGRGR
jgi:hypothetical protein